MRALEEELLFARRHTETVERRVDRLQDGLHNRTMDLLRRQNELGDALRKWRELFDLHAERKHAIEGTPPVAPPTRSA